MFKSTIYAFNEMCGVQPLPSNGRRVDVTSTPDVPTWRPPVDATAEVA